MAYTTINKSSDYFNTKLYTGNGSSQTITGVNFEPDLVWIKQRNGTGNHVVTDNVRTVDYQLHTNTTDAQSNLTNNVTSTNADGFVVNTDGEVNGSSDTYTSWNWKANGAGSANTDGSISSTVSASATSGFSIVKWSGTGATGTVGHGLGVAPSVVIVKQLTGTGAWYSYFKPLGNGNAIVLNTTGTFASTGIWNSTSPTNQVFSVINNSVVNASGSDYIAYCFADVQGFSKIGSYTGGGNNFPFIYTGFKPGFVLIKNYVSSGWDWSMSDIPRDNEGGINSVGKRLAPNVSQAEYSNTSYANIQKLSNGFTFNTNNTEINGQGENYIYMAFAKAPLVGSNNVPANAR